MSSLHRIVRAHLRTANFFAREEWKKTVWGALIWKLRDRNSNRSYGPTVNIKAKVDLEKNRAVVSGIPRAPNVGIIEFVPDRIADEDSKPNGILRLRTPSGQKLEESKVIVPFRLLDADLKRFAVTLYQELAELLGKVRESQSQEAEPAPMPAKPAPAPAPAPPKPTPPAPTPALSSQEQQEIRLVEEALDDLEQPFQNPFTVENDEDGTVEIGFMVPGRSDPLWWTGSGFKNLSTVRARPEQFYSHSEAARKIKSELLDFIRQWRRDQAHLIMGW